MKRNLKPNTFFTCKFCGAENSKYVEPFKTRSGKYTNEFCNRTCAGKNRVREKHPNWKGGIVATRGYIIVHCPEHPSVQGKRMKYVFQHRLVMEAHLGRYLTEDEVGHHKNEDTSDNRLKNLQLCKNQSIHKKIHDPDRERDSFGRYLCKS